MEIFAFNYIIFFWVAELDWILVRPVKGMTAWLGGVGQKEQQNTSGCSKR